MTSTPSSSLPHNLSDVASVSSSVETRTIVNFDEEGQPVGLGSTQFSSDFGNLVHTHVSIYYQSWRHVSISAKEHIWTMLIERIRAISTSGLSSNCLDIDHDPVAQVCGKDANGRVRGKGTGVTRRQIRSSVSMREYLHETVTMSSQAPSLSERHCQLIHTNMRVVGVGMVLTGRVGSLPLPGFENSSSLGDIVGQVISWFELLIRYL